MACMQPTIGQIVEFHFTNGRGVKVARPAIIVEAWSPRGPQRRRVREGRWPVTATNKLNPSDDAAMDAAVLEIIQRQKTGVRAAQILDELTPRVAKGDAGLLYRSIDRTLQRHRRRNAIVYASPVVGWRPWE